MSQLKNDRKPEDVEKSAKRRNVFLHWGASGVAVASAAVVAALLFGECGRSQQATQPAAECREPLVCVDRSEVNPRVYPPLKGDGQCEVDKGEHDPHSQTFDPQSCGYCGDNLRNVWTTFTMVEGQPMREVEVGRETAETCPVDFHCGNGTKELRPVVYGGVIAPRADGGVYSFGPITITESCNPNDSNYCSDDCGGPARRPPAGAGHGGGHGSGAVGEGAAAPVTAPPARPGGPCRNQDSAEVVALKSHLATMLNGAAESVRQAHGPEAGTRVMMSATLSVSAEGRVTGVGVRSWCSGTCATPSVNATSLVGDLGVSGSSIPAEGAACSISVVRPASRN